MKLITASILSLALMQTFAIAEENPKLEVNLDDRPITEASDHPVVTYADVLEEATPSVVSVYTSRLVSGSSRQQFPPELFRQFGLPVPQQRQPVDAQRDRRESLGVGSGVIISTDGYIVTNAHVVTGGGGRKADEILIRLSDDTEYVSELIGYDEKTDVAVLKIESDEPLPAVSIADSEGLRVGDVVFAIGNPLNVGFTVTKGIVSATGRTSRGILGPGAYENFIQTDAAINLGNSGGALVDAGGRLIGINTAIVSSSGGSNGIGFAIPTKMALNVARNLIERGEVPRGLLGLFPENLDRDMAEAFGLESTKGALVNQVQPDSAAERAGIRHGDVILRIDDIQIESAPQLRLVVSQTLPGSEVIVELVRQGELMKLPVVLGSLDGAVVMLDTETSVLEGVSLSAIDERSRAAYSIPDDVDGVLVETVSVDSPYGDRGGLTRGMVILEINGKPVASASDVETHVNEGANRFYVWSQGTHRFIVLRVK
ncbi:MAG: Do family serine endopeptidase [Opitutaceae bacterium]